jgi:Protein of unknown function (DUF3034)
VKTVLKCVALAATIALCPLAQAGVLGADQGKLLLTEGFSDADGAAGAGLVPWAVITGYGSRDSWGANAHYTGIWLNDFAVNAYGVGVGVFDRLELSYTRHDLRVTGTALDGLKVSQNIFGAKLRLFGDAVYSQDSWLPQVAFGAEYKKNRGIENEGPLVDVKQLGAKSDSGTDLYLAATKIFLDESFVLSADVRATKANQFGLLGFGGDLHSGYSAEGEVTAALVLSRSIAVGGEYRMRPHNLGVDNEKDAWDVFAAWTVNKNLSFVLAYLNLGEILTPVTKQDTSQRGAYLSVQVGF